MIDPVRRTCALSRAIGMALLALLATTPLRAGAPIRPGTQTPQGGLASLISPEAVDHISPSERLRLRAVIERYEAEQPPFRAAATVAPPAFPFFPQGGIHGKDLFLQNFADLDPSPGLLDWDCSAYTYDGHQGNDSIIRSFREQAIGVPVFAVLDGRVIETRDGEPDMSTELVWVPANHVVIDHGGGYYGFYWHLKKGSVAVKPGAIVAAGSQIGLTGSSGYSNWPHLHFESWKDDRWFEPSAGPCRPGDSSWVSQPAVVRETYVSDFYFTDGRLVLADYRSYALDAVRRVATFPAGQRTVSQRIDLHNLPGGSMFRMRVLDPSGAVRIDSTGSWGNTEMYRTAYGVFWFTLNLGTRGVWRYQLDVNGAPVVDAPFTVVANAGQVVNRPPARIRVGLSPAKPQSGQVMICRVETSLVFEDPDYDLIRYRYEWKVNGKKVRTVTSAALSDVLARNKVKKGDRVVCKVTPADERTNGVSALAMAAVKGEP